MPLTPGYGETPLPHDELTAPTQSVIEIFGTPITKAEVYDLEQAVQDQMAEELLTATIEGSLLLEELLSDYFVRDLHTRLYGAIWVWAGRLRQHEVNIGVAPEQIAVELRTCLDTVRFRWKHTDDWTPRSLGITVHAEMVRIHPFVDGNGRTTRLLADLVYIAAQERAEWQYDWDVAKAGYIELLLSFDVHRNAGELAAFIGVQSIEFLTEHEDSIVRLVQRPRLTTVQLALEGVDERQSRHDRIPEVFAAAATTVSATRAAGARGPGTKLAVGPR